MRSGMLASILADEAIVAAMVPFACPTDFGPEGRYRLEELISAGGRSLVYRATSTDLLAGRMFASVLGVATAVVAAVAAVRIFGWEEERGRRLVLVTGLLVGLWPSLVLWSSGLSFFFLFSLHFF